MIWLDIKQKAINIHTIGSDTFGTPDWYNHHVAIKVEINKNIVLLYALLNRFNQALGESDSSKLRAEMVEYFRSYSGKEPNVESYKHPSKAVSWALLVSGVPEFQRKDVDLNERQRIDFNYGSYLKPFLIDFYNKTNFDDYYQKVLPKLKDISSQFKKTFKDKNFEEILENIWSMPLQEDMIVIPNPFTQSSFGPKIANKNYQVIGMWDTRSIESYDHNIIHEGSHPLAKKVLEPYKELIDSKCHLLDKAIEHPKYPKSYIPWGTCFEEHLIRAVHRGIISPQINPEYDVEKGLQFELNNKGMIFIEQFYNALINSKSVKDAVPIIIDSLI